MNLSFGKKCLKFLARCEESKRTYIVEAIGELPEKGDIKKLRGQVIKNTFRLRVGRYRIVFAWEGDEIKIIKIDTRGDVYK
jgi:mRNA interferase RelE/StbE